LVVTPVLGIISTGLGIVYAGRGAVGGLIIDGPVNWLNVNGGRRAIGHRLGIINGGAVATASDVDANPRSRLSGRSTKKPRSQHDQGSQGEGFNYFHIQF